MSPNIHTLDQAKARAREIRAEFAAAGSPIGHAAALEKVAGELGHRSWNALSARLTNQPEVPLQVGDRVAGRYLGQGFDARVLAVRSLSEGSAMAITLKFDQPVDVVTFDSFSFFRNRVTATISPGGTSFAKTGDGVPHLIVARLDE
ncbi:MAG: glyoxalase superfamily protein [Thalassobaculaceae bacterium]|nr:glyoxalase superfamily protein [Thalassobaculaceae bacterium]